MKNRVTVAILIALSLIIGGGGKAVAGEIIKNTQGGDRVGSREIAKGIYGRIQWVDSFPDYRVKIVTSFPDLYVESVSSFPDREGRWQIVMSNPDYRIQRVEVGEDFRIQVVGSLPGLPMSR